MNTLRDTDKGRARPSVWPVYVMSVIIGVYSLIFLGWVWFVPWMAQGYAEFSQYLQQLPPGAHRFAHMMQRLVPYAPLFGLYGLFGIVTAVAAARLRSWGWWCTVMWIALYFLWHVFVTVNIGIAEVSLTATLVTAAFYGLIIWLLATRRRLFFPAKSETVTGKKRPRYHVVLFVVVPLVLVAGSAIFLLWHGEGVRDTTRQVTRADPEQARKELQAEFEKIKAAGEPITLEEIIPPEVPDEENAALVYEQAFEKLNLSEEDEDALSDLLSSMARPPRGEAPSTEAIEEIVAKNAGAIMLLENAAQRPKCRFPVEWSAGAEARFPHLGKVNPCARLLAAKAALQIGRGEASEALQTIEIGLSMCEAVRDEPVLISQLVRYVLAQMVLHPLHVVLEEDVVPTASCRELFDYLRRMDFMQSFVHSLWGERVMGIHMFDAVRQDPEEGWTMLVGEDATSDGSLYATPVGQSILNVDEAMYLWLMARKIAAAEKSSWDSREELAEIDRRVEELGFPHFVTTILLPVYARVTAKRDSTIARVGLAQVALALKAYKNEKGEYPQSLAQLREVIEWADLPEDPFSGEDFIYRHEGQGFLVYSIGADLEDDGGKAEEDGEEGDIVWRCAK